MKSIFENKNTNAGQNFQCARLRLTEDLFIYLFQIT